MTPPTQIGKFELRKVLGKGASGTVYLALDTFSGADVALKVLDPEIVAHPDFGETTSMQFMNEASLAGKLAHPHIASIIEAVVSKGSGYIAMEYVPGGDLSQFTRAGRLLDVEDAIEIAYKSCGALDYAARQGIVHRDIKPANIMVAGGTNIKVADFGAAYLHKAVGTQIAGVGTPFYMSPEQIEELPLGHHSDMFALGVVLYELFTGSRPFVAGDLDALFRKILTVDPVAPSALRKGLALDIDRLLLTMMAKKPGDRFTTWAELALEVAHIGRLSVYQHAIPDSEKFTVLRKVAFLERLNDAEIWELVHAGNWSRRPARQPVMREGEPGDSLFLLGRGQVKVTRHGRLLNVLNAGEYFGEMAYIKAGAVPRYATAETFTDVLLAEFSYSALQNASKDCQLQLSNALVHTLVDRLALANERITRGTT